MNFLMNDSYKLNHIIYGPCESLFPTYVMFSSGFPGDLVIKNLPANAGDVDSILGSRRPT